MGVNHARIYADLRSCNLSAVYDRNPDAAQRVARKYRTYAAHSLEEFARLVDAATICTPTITHYEIGAYLLEQGKHLLIEKPVAETPTQARALSALAASRSCVLQVGHIERFNPVLAALEGKLNNPRFLEVTRLSPYPNRSTDIGVVLDLMIHDIDIILSMVPSGIKLVNSVGIPVLSEEVDIANARLQFENGCVANVTASRVSREAVRKIRIFQSDAYISIDYQSRKISIFRKDDGGVPVPGLPNVSMEEKSFEQSDALLAEITAFIDSVRSGTAPVVTGEDGKRALELALQINGKL